MERHKKNSFFFGFYRCILNVMILKRKELSEIIPSCQSKKLFLERKQFFCRYDPHEIFKLYLIRLRIYVFLIKQFTQIVVFWKPFFQLFQNIDIFRVEDKLTLDFFKVILRVNNLTMKILKFLSNLIVFLFLVIRIFNAIKFLNDLVDVISRYLLLS